jgi:hypothetical protein
MEAALNSYCSSQYLFVSALNDSSSAHYRLVYAMWWQGRCLWIKKHSAWKCSLQCYACMLLIPSIQQKKSVYWMTGGNRHYSILYLITVGRKHRKLKRGGGRKQPSTVMNATYQNRLVYVSTDLLHAGCVSNLFNSCNNQMNHSVAI